MDLGIVKKNRSIFLFSHPGASLGSLQDGCKMSSKSHKFPKVSFDFKSLVQTIPLRTGALHPLKISAGANAPAAPVLTRPLSNPYSYGRGPNYKGFLTSAKGFHSTQ